MRKMWLASMLLSVLMLSAGAFPANAALVTSLTGSSVDMPIYADPFGSGPYSFGPGITYTSTTESVFGYTGRYGFTDNGTWEGLTMAGVDATVGTMTFTFDSLISGVGGLINYATNYALPTIAIFDDNGDLIEQSVLSFSTGGSPNSGFFYGFLQPEAIIKSFTLSDAYIGITDIVVASDYQPVPEPSTLLLLGAGVAGVFVLRRKRS